MTGIKDRVSAALHPGQNTATHGTHDTAGPLAGNTGNLHSDHTSGLPGTHGTTGLTGTHGTHSTAGLTGTHGTGTGITGTTGGYDTSHAHMHGTGELIGGSGKVIDSKVFTKTEDHEVLIEKKAYELQHRPVEKEYVVETRYVGEQRVPGAATELVGTEVREVEERVVEAPRGDRAVVVENVDVPREMLQQTTAGALPGTTGHHSTHHSHGTSGVGSTGTPGSTGIGGTNNTTSF